MAITFSCPECGKSVNAPDYFAGKRARCPGCKIILTVPKTEAADEPEYEVAEDGPAPQSTEPPAISPQSVWQPVRGTTPTVSESWSRRVGPSASSLKAAATVLRTPATSGRDRLYWVFVLALIPLGFSLLSEEDDTAERIGLTLEHNEQVVKQFEASKKESFDDLLDALPDGRIEGAHLSHGSWMHWLYAVISAAVFFGVLLLFSRKDSAPPVSLILVGLFTGTIGILLLLGVQWAGFASQGVWFRGRGIAIVIFYIIKFIGFSYIAALNPENGFFLSFFGFTLGVGLCEELCKALPVIMEFRRRSTMGWRGAFLWGLASGVGFGVSEGITYASGHYNGISTWGIYVVRFVSCVALHAMWGGSVGILIYRNRELIDGHMDWSDWIMPLAKFLGVAMVLHGLYDTMLKREMNLLALIVAIASFAWMAVMIEQARAQESTELSEALASA